MLFGNSVYGMLAKGSEKNRGW